MHSTLVRRIGVGAGIVSLAGLIALAFLALLSPRRVATGPISREVSQRVVPLNSYTSVTLEIAPEAVANYQSAPASPPVDVILVVDRSGSMEGEPFEQALAGARSFVEKSDLSRHQVGLVFFTSGAEVAQTLTQEAGALESAMQGRYATDGTSIHEALRAARQELASAARRRSAQPLIVLFSDGGSDTGLAEREAEAAKAEGVRIVAIGLRGADFNPGLLSRVVTSPGDLIVAENPAALEDVFITMAQQINRTIATGFVVEERFDTNRFEVWDDSPAPPAELGPGYLRWGPTVFTEAGAVLRYQLRPLSIGWHSVATGDGAAAMTDYHGNRLEYSQAGPHILVVPSLGPWCLLPLLLVLPMLLLFSRRRRPLAFRGHAGVSASTPRVFERVPANISRLISGVGPLDAAKAETASFPSTLIVGIGDVGAWVLTHVKKNLADRCEGARPDGIRLLSVELEHPDRGGPVAVGGVSLASEERLHLTPDFDEIRHSLQRGKPPYHLRWWQDTGSLTAEGRANGRMALFWDVLALSGESRLRRACHDALAALDRPRVFIVASLGDDTGSALLWDLAYLIRWIQKDRTAALRRLVFWLALPALAEGPDSRTRRGRRYAAMRELERLTYQMHQPYDFGAGLSGVSRGSPVDQCILFDAEAEDEVVHLKDTPLPQGLLVAMADGLTAVLDQQVHSSFERTVTRSSREATRRQLEIEQCLVSGLGCLAYKLPVEDIRRAAEARFVRDLLFNPEGTVEGGLLRVQEGESRAPELDAGQKPTATEAREAAVHFLRSTSLHNHHDLFATVGDAIRHQRQYQMQESAEPPTNPVDVFRWRLQEHLTELLNGSGEDHVSARSGRLLFALETLKALEDVLAMAKPSLQAPQELLDGWIAGTREAREEVEVWIAALIGQPSSRESDSWRIRRPSTQDKVDNDGPTLYSLVDEDWQRCRSALEKQRLRSPTRRLLLEPGSTGPRYEGLEAPHYRRHMRPELSREVGPARRPLNRMMQRVLWYWDEEDGASQLKMLVLPIDFDGARSDWRDNRHGPEDIGPVHDALRDLARVFSRSIRTGEQIAPYLRDRGLAPVAGELLKGEKPLLRYDRARAVQETQFPQDTELFLVGPESGLVDSLAEEMVHTEPVRIVSDDPHTCLLLGLRSFIPLNLLDTYVEDEQEYYLDPALHVFPAEQTAVRFERRRRQKGERRPRFHPLFVRLLENEDLARLFGLACIYGWVRKERGDQGQPEWVLRIENPALSVQLTKGRDRTLLHAMEAFALALPIAVKAETHPLFSRNLMATQQALEKALAEARQAPVAERLARYREFETTTIQVLEHSASALERDLAVLLAVLLEGERLT